MLFALAGTDALQIDALLHLPLREVCMLYLNWLKERARESYTTSFLAWSHAAAVGSRSKAPALPLLLK